MVGKASELCLPWLGPGPSINNRAAPPPAWPQLAWPRDPTSHHPQGSHSSPAQLVWVEDPNTHMLGDLEARPGSSGTANRSTQPFANGFCEHPGCLELGGGGQI